MNFKYRPQPNWRNLTAFTHDLGAAALAWIAAYTLRFNLEIPPQFSEAMLRDIAWIIPLQALFFLSCGMYKGLWRYASLPDFKRLLMSAGLGAMSITAVAALTKLPDIPRSVFIVYFLVLVATMGSNRLLYRAFKEKIAAGNLSTNAKRVLILGAGSAGADLARAMGTRGQWRIIGFLDDNRSKYASQIQGFTVLGTISELAEIAQSHEIQLAILAMPGENPGRRRRATQICQKAGVAVMTVPSYEELVSGRVTVSGIRAIELDDLLGRDPVELDNESLSQWLRGRSVLVTGAGGSIGAELCRQLLRFAPAKLVLYDRSELALYDAEQEFGPRHHDTTLAYLVGDIKDALRLEECFKVHAPSIVFHAAAYKHVPLMETDNAWQAVQNNGLGTWRVAEAALQYNAEKFVLVSTDKAVNPTNVMGASKRLAELLCQPLSTARTRFVAVRFGNVLGSTGSVIPKFRKQIAEGGPVTVTHPDIRRYFMSIPEAAQLVLQAGVMGQGGEIFVLDMGEAVKIADLARDLIRLSGFGQDDIKILYTGLRPGEKLYEELLANDEHTVPTPHPKLRISRTGEQHDESWVKATVKWLEIAKPMRAAEVRAELAARIPEYKPALLGDSQELPANIIDWAARFGSR